METIICDLHESTILIFEPDEEYLFSEKIDGTVIFCDTRGSYYLKKFTIGKCDENCPEIQKILR